MSADFPFDDLAPDSIVLVSGPPMTGKYRLMLELLAEMTDQAIFVSTKNQARQVVDEFRTIAGDVPEDHIGVVDCVSHHDTVGGQTDTATVKFATSPENLTRIGVKFTELFETFNDRPNPGQTGVGIHSLSQLLMYADVKKVYKFLQVLIGQVRGAGWFGVAVVDESVVDSEQLDTLQHHFDGIVQTRLTENGDREYRVRGLAPAASDWGRL